MSRILDFDDGFTTSTPSTMESILATEVSNVPSGNISSTNVQSALNEIQSDLDTHKSDVSNPHAVTKSQVGLGNVDNTSDVNKPVSIAQAAADASTLSSANTYTDNKVASLVNSAPATLDTLNELSTALGNDPNFATTTATALGNRLRLDIDTQGLNSTQKTNAKTNIDLNNVTNDAQLKRASGDINSFTEKSIPVDDDVFIIEDSQDSFNKKKVKALNIGMGGGGAVNLIDKGNADKALNSIFIPYQDAASTRPIDGAGGTPTVTTSVSSTNPLNGTKSFLLTKPASNCQGQGWSVPFTVDKSYRARKCKVSVDVLVNSGSLVAGTSTSESSVIFYLYDVTNSQLIEPSNFKLFSNSTTLVERYEGEFQTSANGSSYRLIAHVTDSSTSSFELMVDNILITPGTVSNGNLITDWQLYAPIFQGLGTPTAQEIYWRRVGEEMQVSGKLTVGSPSAVEARIYFPNNLIGKVLTQGIKRAGEGIRATNTSNDINVLIESGVGYFTFDYQHDGGTTGINKQTGASLFAASNTFVFQASATIEGWQSNTKTSDGYDGRDISSKYYTTVAQTTSTTQPLDFSTRVYDTTLAVTTGSNWKFVAPVNGKYRISVWIPSVGTADYRIYKNGTDTGETIAFGINGGSLASGSTTVDLKTNDYIDIRTTGSVSISAGNQCKITIDRLASPQVVTIGETIAASYWMSSSTTVASNQQINFDSKEYDTHGAVNVGSTWNFKAPITGIYTLKGFITFNSGTGYLQLFVNGTLKKYIGYNGGAGSVPATVSCDVKLNSGDIIDLRPTASINYLGGTLASGASHISILKVG